MGEYQRTVICFFVLGATHGYTSSVSHWSAHITGTEHNVLHISHIVNAQKDNHISMNLWTKAHSRTLKLSQFPFSFTTTVTTFKNIYLINYTHQSCSLYILKEHHRTPQWTPQCWSQREESGSACPLPGQQRASYKCQPLAPPDFKCQPCSTIHNPFQRELHKSLNLII